MKRILIAHIMVISAMLITYHNVLERINNLAAVANVNMIRLDEVMGRGLENWKLSRVNQADIEAINSEILPISVIQSRIVEPTVQVIVDNSSGSGTILKCEETETGDYTVTVLTSFHVAGMVDISRVMIRTYAPIATDYRATGKHKRDEFDMMELYFTSKSALPTAMVNLDRETPVGQRVWSCSCPLGNAPLLTTGLMSSKSKEVNGLTLWVASSPISFGSSGSGIFNNYGELIGVVSMVGSINSLIAIPVAHIAVFVPIR